MSRTQKQRKAPGYDFWSRRCFGGHCHGYGAEAKRKTKRQERTRDKKLERLAYDHPEEVEGRFPGE